MSHPARTPTTLAATARFALFALFAASVPSAAHAAGMLLSVTEPNPGIYTAPVLVTGGFGEDVLAFSDRTHQWNSVSAAADNSARQPTIAGLGLVGKDYIRTANDARAISAANPAYQIELAQKSQVFLFLDARGTAPAWLSTMGFKLIPNSSSAGAYRIGVDEGGTDAGPGLGINNQSWVYTATLPAGTHTLNGAGMPSFNNFGIVATLAGTAVGGVTRLAGNTAKPALDRLAFSSGILTFSDRAVPNFVYTDPLPSTMLELLDGADYVRTSNDARTTSTATALYEVTLLGPSQAFLFLDNRVTSPPAWIAAMGFTPSSFSIGIDETGNSVANQTSRIYQAYLGAGTYNFFGQGTSGFNNYSLAFALVPEPSRALLLLLSLPLLLRRRRRP